MSSCLSLDLSFLEGVVEVTTVPPAGDCVRTQRLKLCVLNSVWLTARTQKGLNEFSHYD